MPVTPISSHPHGLTPRLGPREPVAPRREAPLAHLPRARTLHEPQRARSPCPQHASPATSTGSHPVWDPASPLIMPATPISSHLHGLTPSDTPYLSQRNTEATQENRQKTTKNRKTTPDRRSSIRPNELSPIRNRRKTQTVTRTFGSRL